MSHRVISYQVSCFGYRACQCGLLSDKAPDQKERRPDAVPGKQIKKLLRYGGIRPVIVSQCKLSRVDAGDEDPAKNL